MPPVRRCLHHVLRSHFASVPSIISTNNGKLVSSLLPLQVNTVLAPEEGNIYLSSAVEGLNTRNDMKMRHRVMRALHRSFHITSDFVIELLGKNPH